MSINGTAKKRGRPATGLGTGINVRLQPSELNALDGWIAVNYPGLSRPEGIRRLMTMGLGVED